MTDQVEQKPDGLKAATAKVFESFYIPAEVLKSFVEECEDLPASLKGSADAFVSNINSATRAASIPYTLTNASTTQRTFDRFHTAERIRAKPIGESRLTDELEREAYEKSDAKMDKFLKSDAGVAEIVDAVIWSLAKLSEDAEFQLAAQELLSNTTVMVWGAFEAFVSDALTVFLNLNPKLASTLLSDGRTKKHFSEPSIEAIESCGFDVSGSMGKLLLGERGIDRLPVIKDVFQTLFPTHSDLHATMKKDGLWLLWQRRHLLVHKRGLVDAVYLKQTGDKQPVGARLRISGSYLDEILKLVSDAGVQFVRALKAAS
jgi:hypothetical protein